MTTLLLDTDVLSEQTRAMPDERLVDWLERNAPAGFAISAVTLGEVRYGCGSTSDVYGAYLVAVAKL